MKLTSYIKKYYGLEHGAKVKFAREFGLSSQHVNNLINQDCIIVNGKILTPCGDGYISYRGKPYRVVKRK